MSHLSASNNNSNNQNEPFMDKMKRVTGNCLQATGLCCFKAKENAQIQVLESKIANRQKKFGVDYLNLVQDKAPQSELKKCLQDALRDIGALQEEVNSHYDEIENKTEATNQKIKKAPGSTSNNSEGGGGAANSSSNVAPSAGGGKNTGKRPPGGAGASGGGASGNNNANKSGGGKAGNKKPSTRAPPVGGGGGKGGGGKAAAGKPSKKAVASSHSAGDVADEFKDADPAKWKCVEMKFAGSAAYEEKGREEKVKGTPIPKGLEHFKAHPELYVAMMFQSDMVDWPGDQHEYMLLHRKGTSKWAPQGVGPSGWMTLYMNEYHQLPRFKDDILPKSHRDKYTDSMTFRGKKIHTKNIKPIMPGRGMGWVDSPNLKIIGDIDPSDIFQGSVGDCWLLSGISSLAEFDGAIKKLFRKTKNIDKMPFDDGTPNMYTVTLWDLSTWTEVDIVIDERLPANPDGSGGLLASKPSEDGELWACYLEKALAVHCGGWDKIVGGQCTHAWALMTGCKYQYTIFKNKRTGKYGCYAKFNPITKEWSKHANSPHDCDGTSWRVAWPEVGGGGDENLELDEEELFLRLYAWDQENYIVGAGTSGVSDSNSTGGMVDNHAYSVIESVDNVAGTDIDLIKVRNPWGKGEIEDGEFDDDGPGWDKYPQIKKALNPVVADDGIFWVTKKEFFQFFPTIYVSASNMTEFLED